MSVRQKRVKGLDLPDTFLWRFVTEVKNETVGPSTSDPRVDDTEGPSTVVDTEVSETTLGGDLYRWKHVYDYLNVEDCEVRGP